MTIPVNEIITLVIARLGESEPLLDDAIEFGSPEFDLRSRIRLEIPLAAEEVLRQADIREIRESMPFTGEVYWRGGVARVRLPEDFIRMVSLRMSDWEEGVTVFMDAGSEAASLRRLWQRRGPLCHRQHPSATLSDNELEIYGTRSSVIDSAAYLPVPRIEEEKLIFPRALLSRLVERLATGVVRGGGR